jgi:hypothetical protein
MHNGRIVLAVSLLAVVAVAVVAILSQGPRVSRTLAPDSASAPTATVALIADDGYPPPRTPDAATHTPAALATSLRQLTTARYLSLESWSPDGQWLAAWVDASTPEPGVPAPGNETMRFVETSSGHHCDHPELQRQEGIDGSPQVVWLEDGMVRVDALGGRPCAGSFATLPGPLYEPMPPAEGGAVSADRRFRADTEVLSTDEDGTVQHMETTLTQLENDRVGARVPWKRSVWFSGTPIGQWLPDGSFLIRQTLDRGPLRVTLDGTVSEIAPELFDVPGTGANDDSAQLAFAVPGEGLAYHLALWSRRHGLRLHHPETGTVESLDGDLPELPRGNDSPDSFKIENPLWGTPWPAGWLVVEGPSTATFARRADPPGGPWTLLPADRDASRWSPDGRYLATRRGWGPDAELELVSFPDLAPVSRQPVPWLERPAWSPDGRKLAVTANSGDGVGGALYLVDVPAP